MCHICGRSQLLSEELLPKIVVVPDSVEKLVSTFTPPERRPLLLHVHLSTELRAVVE